MRLSFLFAVAVFIGCAKPNKYQAQLNTVDTLIQALYNNDTLKVADLVGVNPENIGSDRERFEREVRIAVKRLRKEGLPKKNSYTIKEYPPATETLIMVEVPFGKHNDSRLIINFPNFLPPSKIGYFLVDTPIETPTKPTLAPMPR